MTIESIEYFSGSGISCDGIFGVSAFPYSTSDVQHDGGPIGARWKHEGKVFSWQTADKVSIYPSPDFTCLVVIFLRNSPLDFHRPHNALILNADGSLRCQVLQPERFAGRMTEFLDAWWYYRDIPPLPPPWWAFWRKAPIPQREIRMKMLIGGQIALPNRDFVALDFNPETGEFGEVVDSGRL